MDTFTVGASVELTEQGYRATATVYHGYDTANTYRSKNTYCDILKAWTDANLLRNQIINSL